MSSSRERILIVRPDRLGDVVLSTPVISALKTEKPQAEIYFLIRKSWAPLFKDLSALSGVILYEPEGQHAGARGWRKLVSEIKTFQFNAAVILQSTARVTAAVWAAGIKKRIGPWSRFHSFLFINNGARQHRSQVLKHEAEYNLDLLKLVGVNAQQPKTGVNISSEAKTWAKNFWEKNSSVKRIGIHPGMGGSAGNLPLQMYVELIRALSRENYEVLVSLGPMDFNVEKYLRIEIPEIFAAGGNMRVFQDFSRDISFLGALFENCDFVIAPSTGPLHLAVALGRPVISFFPEKPEVQSSKRWGPYQPSAMAKVFSPLENFAVTDVLKTIKTGHV